MHAIDASSCFYLNLQSKSKVESNGKRTEMKDRGYYLTVHVKLPAIEICVVFGNKLLTN